MCVKMFKFDCHHCDFSTISSIKFLGHYGNRDETRYYSTNCWKKMFERYYKAQQVRSADESEKNMISILKVRFIHTRCNSLILSSDLSVDVNLHGSLRECSKTWKNLTQSWKNVRRVSPIRIYR
jgi:hypothetical protein